MNGFIYKITNKVNNKVYIGQTRYTIESRWRQHLKNFNIEHRRQPLYKAFEKYGIENFEVEQVEEVNVDKLDEREIFWIAKYDSFKNGYNATLGGQEGRIYFWTDSQYEEIRTMYLSGFTSTSISKHYNVSSWVILNILKSLNIKIKRNPLAMNSLEKAEFIKRYENGTSLKELAEDYNTDKQTVKRFLLKNNVNLRVHSKLINDEVLQKEMIDDYINGMRYLELEKKYFADNRTIKKILVKHGINIDLYRGSKRTKKGPFCLTDEECLEVIKLYNTKTPLKEISKKFNINITTIYNLLERYNVTYRRHNFPKSVRPLKDNQG